MNEAPRSLPARHRVGVVQALGALALALVCGTACSIVPVGQSSTNTCSAKVVQEITTNRPVSGVWGCLSASLQSKLKQYVTAGLAKSADDAVFTDGTSAKPPVLATHYVGTANGVDVYTVVLQTSSGVQIDTVSVWTVSGKVDNFAIGTPTF